MDFERRGAKTNFKQFNSNQSLKGLQETVWRSMCMLEKRRESNIYYVKQKPSKEHNDSVFQKAK